MTDILIKSNKKNIVMDASLMNDSEKCGRYTDLRHNRLFVSNKGKSNSLEVGSLVHKVLEIFDKSRIHNYDRKTSISNGIIAGQMYISGCPSCTEFIPLHHYTLVEMASSEKELKHICNNKCTIKPKCGHQINEYPGMQNTPTDSDKYNVGWKYALDTCEQYFDFWKNDSWIPLAAEIVKGEVLYEDDNIRVLWKAKLDSIVKTDIGERPMDHKTQKQNRDKPKLNNQFIGQCMIMGTRSMIINEIGFQTTLKPEEKFKRTLINYTADNLLEWQSERLPQAAYNLLSFSENNVWPATGWGINCETKFGKCTYHNICESDRHMREEELKLHFIIGQKWNPVNEDV